MRLVRSLIVIVCSMLFLLTLHLSVIAQIVSPASKPEHPVADTPEFTWGVTVTIEPGNSLSTALYSQWTNALFSFPVGPGGVSFAIVLPSDSTGITASVGQGSFSIVGTTIHFTFTGISDASWTYRTAQQVLRSGNQFYIDQRTSSNTSFRSFTTIIYPPANQYVGTITNTPQTVTSNTLYWDSIVPLNDTINDPPWRHLFAARTWLLVDPSLSRPDLSVSAASLSIETDLNPPIAHLTTTVRNNAPDILSNQAFLQFYSRLSPSTPPSSPIDHTGGWCGGDAEPHCPVLATFTNPVPLLTPGQSITLTAAYSLTEVGLRDFYLQIDTFGGPLGLNAESDEANNTYSLTRGVPIYYLAGVAITGPITGLVNTPYSFNAQVAPTTAVNLPLTYTWSPPPAAGQGTALVTYTWPTDVPQTITATIRNPKNVVVTDTHTIAIYIPLSGVVISGAHTAAVDIPYVYTALVTPLTATKPVTYIWSPEPDAGQGTSLATYTWRTLDPATLSVVVQNPAGLDVNTVFDVVPVPPSVIYLPLVRKS